jgi:hypothetical protein
MSIHHLNLKMHRSSITSLFVKVAVLQDVSLCCVIQCNLPSVPVGTFDGLTAAGDLRAQVWRVNWGDSHKSYMSMPMSMMHAHFHAACPCPCCMLMVMPHVHVHAACLCINVAYPCPCCMSMSPCCMSMLCFMLHVHAAYLVQLVNTAWPCCRITP